MRILRIVGVGMGGLSLLTNQASLALKAADEVFAFDRIADNLSSLCSDITVCSFGELAEKVESSKADVVAVLVSGDGGFFSASTHLEAKFPHAEIQRYCGINSLQYLCSQAHYSYDQASVVSLHGRGSVHALIGSITHRALTFALTGNTHNTRDILDYLVDKLPGDIKVTIGENLSLEDERISVGSIAELAGESRENLAVILFENPHPVTPGKVYRDTDFTRGCAPMTKQDVRWVSVNNLDISPTDVVYDIGAGTGSVAFEMASRAYQGSVFALERKADAHDLLCENRRALRAFNVIPLQGIASDLIGDLPVCDKVFIGGSGKELSVILEKVLAKNPQVTIVVNAIALETLGAATSLFAACGLTYTLSCLNSAHDHVVAGYTMMKAQNPIYILKGSRSEA